MKARTSHFAAIAVSLALGAHAQALQYPQAEKKPVTDSFHGTQVSEDYRWLENGKDPAVREWSLAQLKVTRGVLDALPSLPPLKARLKDLYGTAPVRYFEFFQRGSFFAMKRQPPKNQPFLVVMKSAGDVASERVLLDPNALDAKGTTAIDWYFPSLDGKYVAVCLSENGSEDGSVHVIETATGKRLADVVPRAQYPTGGGSLAWDEKATGFYYTRYPQGSERSAEAALSSTRDGRYVLATVANGDGGEHAFYLRNPAGRWTRVADHGDQVKAIELGFDGKLYLLSRKDAPRGKVLSLPIDKPELAAARVVVPEGEASIEAMEPAASRLYVAYMVGGPSEVRVFDLAGKRLQVLPTEPVSSNQLGARLGGDEILVGSQSYLKPFAWYRYSPKANKLEKTALAGESKVNFDDAEVVREMAVSKDGTKVPVNILMKKGTKRDGSNPVLLYGYGGYGVNETPRFSLSNRVWLDHGGIYAVVNLRGGGEFGEEWHLAGNLTRKQNVFDDMTAAARHMIDRGYTRPDKLAALGGSNGGLLMGAIATQRPDLFKAVVSAVGIYDMLRVELTPNGSFNVTEFGTVKDPAQFKALYAYSPYHNVKDGTAYPAILLTTGENDGRVDPYNSRKMAARLQAANPNGRPVLLRVSMDTGHGVGTSLEKRVEETADEIAFLMSQLGMQ